MSISYADTRDSEHLRLLTPAVDQTVSFFPGGPATNLLGDG